MNTVCGLDGKIARQLEGYVALTGVSWRCVDAVEMNWIHWPVVAASQNTAGCKAHCESSILG